MPECAAEQAWPDAYQVQIGANVYLYQPRLCTTLHDEPCVHRTLTDSELKAKMTIWLLDQLFWPSQYHWPLLFTQLLLDWAQEFAFD